MNQKILEVFQTNLVELSFQKDEQLQLVVIQVKINIPILKHKIQTNNKISIVDKQNYLNIIDGIKQMPNNQNLRNAYQIQIEIGRQATYNFWAKTYNLKSTRENYYLLRQEYDDSKIIAYFHLMHNMITFNYTSQNEDQKQLNYLNCSSSSKLVLRKIQKQQEEANQEIAIPLSFYIPTRHNYYQTKKYLQLKRSKDEVIKIKIKWELDNNHSINIDILSKNDLNNFKIKGILYSRILDKESSDLIAQAHKKLSDYAQAKQITQNQQTLTLQQNKEFPLLFFGDNIQSHQIVILTLNFNSWNFLKTNEFQIEVPVDLYPDFSNDDTKEVQDELIEIIYGKYFDSIRVLNKPYQDYQIYN